jgi:hypothetical protein
MKLLFYFFFGICSAGFIFAHDGLPHILLIGAQKSGTTALMKILCQHPNIVSQSSNEGRPVHFFNFHYENGIDWYKGQFPQSVSSDTLLLDKTPDYLFYSNVPEKAFQLLPKAKIIVLLRNPVDRAYSQYWMHIRRGFESSSFEKAIAAERRNLGQPFESILEQWDVFSAADVGRYTHLSRGLYAIQLERWFRYYPRNQILIIETEDLHKNIQKTTEDIVAFLGLPPYEGFDFSVGKVHRYPPMALETRLELSRFFQPFNQLLETLLERKFDWNEENLSQCREKNME